MLLLHKFKHKNLYSATRLMELHPPMLKIFSSIVYKETSKLFFLNQSTWKLKSQTHSQFNEFILPFVISLLPFLCVIVLWWSWHSRIWCSIKLLEQKIQNSSSNTNANTNELQTATNLKSCGPSNKSAG